MVEKRSSVAISGFGRSPSVMRRVLVGGRLPGLAQRQRQRADRGGKRELLRRRHLDLERDRLGERRLVGALVGDLIDRQHAHVLQHDVGGGEVLVLLARQHDIDAIARQHEAGDALDVIDADGHGLHAVLQQRRQGRALAGAGDLGREHRLVRLDRREHDAAAARGQVADLVEGTGRYGTLPAIEFRATTSRRARRRSAAASKRPRSSASRSAFSATRDSSRASRPDC